MQNPAHQRALIPLALFALFMIPSLDATAAQSDREQRTEREIRVKKAVELRPRSHSEVIIPEFKALFLSDGSVTLSGKGTARAGEPVHGFDFEVDLAQGTYSTREIDQAEIERRDLLAGRSRGKEPTNRLQTPLNPGTKAITPGSYTARVRVQTKDPVFIILTETMTRLSWTVSSSGAVTGIQPSSDSCWAANPSSLGTHWFVSYCLNGALYNSAGRVCNDNQGEYYNYDFGFANDITTASQYVYACGRNDAIYDYNWSHNDGGEGALLIYGSVVLG